MRQNIVAVCFYYLALPSSQVMTTLSILEMFIRNAYDHGIIGITSAVLAGGLTYFVLQPYFPDFEPESPAQVIESLQHFGHASGRSADSKIVH